MFQVILSEEHVAQLSQDSVISQRYTVVTHIYPTSNPKGFRNDNAVTLLDSSIEQANYPTNNENLIDYMQDTYVAPDYVE